ncbi:MAG: uroporphyrinogen-III C-methyltransferase [Pseudomonadota bacterium]
MNETSSTETSNPAFLPSSEMLNTNPDPKNNPSKKKSYGRMFFIFLCIMCLGTLAAAAFGYRYFIDMQNQVAQHENRLKELSAVQAQTQQQTKNLNSFQRNVQQLTTEQSSLNEQITANQASTQKELIALNSALKKSLNQMTEKLNRVVGSDLAAIQVEQITNFLILSQKRLVLTDDPAGALALLDQAMSLGNQITDPDFLPVMQAMAEERANIARWKLNNLDSLSTRLQVLMRRLSEFDWTFKPNTQFKSSESTTAVNDTEPFWQRFWQGIQDVLSTHVIRIQRTEQQIPVSYNIEYSHLIAQQSATHISMAQLALLRYQYDAAHEALTTAKNLLANLKATPNNAKDFEWILQELDDLQNIIPAQTENDSDLTRTFSALQKYQIVLAKRFSSNGSENTEKTTPKEKITAKKETVSEEEIKTKPSTENQ